MKLKKEFANLR
jgi:predicted component of type VI protein secretion system